MKRRTTGGEDRVWEVFGPSLERLRRPAEEVGEECVLWACAEEMTQDVCWPR